MTVKVALIQCEVSDADSAQHRRQKIRNLVLQAAGSGAQMVLLPELWPNGAFNVGAMSQQQRGDFESFRAFICDLAREAGVWLHGGSDTEVTADGQRYNTSVLADAAGVLVSTYRKMHLWGGDAGEAAVLSAGEELLVVDSPLGTTGVTTCYELRFPELYRALVDQGVMAYVVAAGWPVARIEHWRVLAQARAIENQAWLLAVNCVGTHDGVQMGGRSVVVSPQGAVIAEASGDSEEILFAEVDSSAAEQWRAKFGWLKDRRSY